MMRAVGAYCAIHPPTAYKAVFVGTALAAVRLRTGTIRLSRMSLSCSSRALGLSPSIGSGAEASTVSPSAVSSGPDRLPKPRAEGLLDTGPINRAATNEYLGRQRSS